MSANEHAVPEAFFNDPNSTQRQAEGVSAVKAIQLAAQQGQTIYQITSENAAQVLPLLTHKSDTIRDIQNAINAGKTVTTSQNPINLNGWVGTGYIVFDPTTGSGGYMINGGLNGGGLDFFGSNANAFALILGIASVLATLGPVSLPIMLALIAVTFFVAAMVTMYNNLILIVNANLKLTPFAS